MQLKLIFKKIKSLSKQTVLIYVVGGFVRDLLLSKEQFKDIDFVVEGSGIVFAEKFDKLMKQAGRLITFPEFDTARYLFLDEQDQIELELEFAGARQEKYSLDSRKPQVSATNLEQDLARRDFTVNAMALPIDKMNSKNFKKYIVDPFEGQLDLKNKILRTPLDPKETFSDDPLRMMRAVRFAAQLDFSLEPKTLKAIYDNRGRINIVSAERVQEELLKILACHQPSIALNLMFQTHLLDLILPEVAQLDGVEEIYGQQHKNNLVHTFKVVDNIARRSDKIMLRLAGLLHDIGKFGTKEFKPKTGWTFYQHEHLGRKLVYRIARRLRLSKKNTDYLAELVRWHQQPISLMDEGITDSAVRRLIVNLEDNLEDLLILGVSDITTGNPYKLKKRQDNYVRLRKRIEEVREKDKLRAFQSPIRGKEIMEVCNLKPGPTVGKIKEDIEEAILDGKIANDYEEAKKYFAKIKDGYLQQAKESEIK